MFSSQPRMNNSSAKSSSCAPTLSGPHYSKFSIWIHDKHRKCDPLQPVYFSKSCEIQGKIKRMEALLQHEIEVVEMFNHHCATVTDSLEISINDSILLPTDGMLDSVDKA